MYRLFTTLFAMFILSGCVSPMKDFIDKHYVLEKKDASLLEGPYKMKEVLSPNSILVEKAGQEIKIIMRGCKPTNIKELNFRAIKLLGTMWPHDIYLRQDCTSIIGKNTIKGIVYGPANQVFMRKNKNGKSEFDVLTYTVKQLKLILYGYCLLDHTDTDYPMYKVFKEAESLAKENKEGYWKTHSE